MIGLLAAGQMRNWDSIPGGGKRILSSSQCLNSYEVHSAPYPIGTMGSFPRHKAAQCIVERSEELRATVMGSLNEYEQLTI
jgi:hypothetical protein